MPFGKGIRADRWHDDEKETGTEKILRLSKISRICWKDGGKYDTMITIKLPRQKGDTMNILFFLTPKSEVEYVFDDFTIRQTIEKMEYHRFSEVPVIDREGHYTGTITEGDLLWYVKEQWDLNMSEAENVRISGIGRKRKTAAVSADARMEDLMEKAMNQNFVPVVDDKNIFIGIVKRKDIIGYFYRQMSGKPEA